MYTSKLNFADSTVLCFVKQEYFFDLPGDMNETYSLLTHTQKANENYVGYKGETGSYGLL